MAVDFFLQAYTELDMHVLFFTLIGSVLKYQIQSPIMPKATQWYAHEKCNLLNKESNVPNGSEEEASSDQEIDQEPDPEVTFHPARAQQAILSMFKPYTEGPMMDWTVNDALYHRFLKWCLKCENILECELVALPECQKCKKVIAWSGDFGMDQYVSWGLSNKDLNLDTIWGKCEEFCKPQTNKVRAHCYLLTSFQQGNRSVDEWYNAVQAQVNLAK